MYKCILIFIFVFFSFQSISAQSTIQKKFKVKEFYLGMDRSEVQTQYELFLKNKIAQYISIEKEKYRDIIKLDNELSSMGNKLEIGYNEKGKCNSITFQYKTVNILFNASKLDAKEFVQKFQKEYKIPKMEFKDMGFVKSWIYNDKKRGIKLTIDDSKNLRLQYLKN